MDMMWYRRRGLMVTPHIKRVTGAIASFNSDYNKIPIKSLICDIEPIQKGTGDPSPENVRPISGRTGLSVVRSGKNLIPHFLVNDNTAFGLTLSPRDDGTILISGAPTNGSTGRNLNRRTFSRGELSLKAGTYTLKTFSDNPYIFAQVVTYDNGTFVVTTGQNTKTIETDFDVHFLDIGINANNGESVNVVLKPQLEIGSTATDYEPYKGSTYSVNWETEAGTVYGGMLDVVSGKLVVDKAKGVLNGTESWAGSSAEWYTPKQDMLRLSDYSESIKADKLITVRRNGVSQVNWHITGYLESTTYPGQNWIYVRLSTDITTREQVASWFSENHVEYAYPLAVPIEIQLTPQEVKTLLTNNIWCDSGGVTVDYWKWGK